MVANEPSNVALLFWMVKGCGDDLQGSKKVFTYVKVFRGVFTLVTKVALGTDTFFSVPTGPIVALHWKKVEHSRGYHGSPRHKTPTLVPSTIIQTLHWKMEMGLDNHAATESPLPPFPSPWDSGEKRRNNRMKGSKRWKRTLKEIKSPTTQMRDTPSTWMTYTGNNMVLEVWNKTIGRTRLISW